MNTLYNRIKEEIAAKESEDRFLNGGLSDGTLIRFKDGTIRPRYCQFCAEIYGRDSVPKVQGWEFNITEKMLDEVRNYPTPSFSWDMFWHEVYAKLKEDGYDFRRMNFTAPMLCLGKQYNVFCDVCGLNSGWYLSQKDALRSFDEIVQEQIEYHSTFREE